MLQHSRTQIADLRLDRLCDSGAGRRSWRWSLHGIHETAQHAEHSIPKLLEHPNLQRLFQLCELNRAYKDASRPTACGRMSKKRLEYACHYCGAEICYSYRPVLHTCFQSIYPATPLTPDNTVCQYTCCAGEYILRLTLHLSLQLRVLYPHLYSIAKACARVQSMHSHT